MTDQASPVPVKYRYGSWNVRSIAGKNEESKRSLLCHQLGIYDFHLVCLQETRLITAKDHIVPNWGRSKSDPKDARCFHYHFANSSADEIKRKGKTWSHPDEKKRAKEKRDQPPLKPSTVGTAGVGFAWRHDLVRCREFRSVSSRLCWGHFEPQEAGGSKSFIAVSCYAPTLGNKEETIKFYLELDSEIVKLQRNFKKKYLYVAGDFNTSFGNNAIYLGKEMTHFRHPRENEKTSWNARKFLGFVKKKGFRVANIEKKCAKEKQGERPSDDTWSHPRTKRTSLKDLLITSNACYRQVKVCKPLGPWHSRILSDHRPIVWELDRKNANFQTRTEDESSYVPQINARNSSQGKGARNSTQTHPSGKNQNGGHKNDP